VRPAGARALRRAFILGGLAGTWWVTGARAGRAQASDTTRGGHPRSWNEVEDRFGSARLEIAVLYDVSGFRQDSASVSQVGAVPTVGQVRQDRIIIEGKIGRRHPWRYLFNADYDQLRANLKTGFTLNDLALSIPLGSVAWLTAGRQKEGISEEMLASTRTLSHVERSAGLLAFIPTRNDGLRLWGTVTTTSRGRGGWTLGVYNNALFNGLSLAANGEQIAGRAFWAPFVSADTLHVVQLALNGRWTDDRNGTLSFKAKPEVFEAPDFVRTGSVDTWGAALGDAGLLLQQGSVSLTAEALPVRVMGAEPRALTFSGNYVELAWRPRGEPRAYDEETGSLGRVRLGRHRVAVELGARYTHVDLSDRSVDGGVFDRSSVGATVYGPHELKLQIDYGYGVLNKGGVVGHTHLLTTRFQWEVR
jgi:phosphate-selective porin OprO and OprP